MKTCPLTLLVLMSSAPRPHAHGDIGFAIENVAELLRYERMLLEMREQRGVGRTGSVMARGVG